MEKWITIKEAASLFPGSSANGRISPATVRSWLTHGRKGVRLEGWKAGGRFVTSEAALERFFQALAAREARPAYVEPHNTLDHQLAVADLVADGW